MVGRRKQLKPNSAKGDRPEDITNLQSYADTRLSLVALPAEIQGIITSHLVQLRDLNHLCCTCKALSAVVLPTLYHTIELKVPLRWSRLPSLENLLASSSEGFKYTKCLKIVTKQYYREDNPYPKVEKIPETDKEGVVENWDESGDEAEEAADTESANSDEDEEADGINRLFRIYDPHPSASNALNAFIRVLVVKLQPQQLHTFWWDHACSLNALTLSTVLKHQGASIHTLDFRKHTGSWRKADLAQLTIGGLKTLGIAELGSGDSSWATELLTRNYQNLCHLRLGSDANIVIDYAIDGWFPFDEIGRQNTDNVAVLMGDKIQDLNEPSTPVVRLESLSLVGLDLHAFANGSIAPVIDFNSLSILKLESCACLEAAFPLLTGSGSGKRKAKSALRLRTLAIRHESTVNDFLRQLEIFLLSLKPLTHLHVLLEGHFTSDIEMQKILRVHGKLLRSLVWDERTEPRNGVRKQCALFPSEFENLELIAKHCPGLTALGISLDWKDLARSEENHKKIASSFSRLSQLQTLNIRNLPAAKRSESWLPIDYMMDGLATMFINIITKKAQIERAPALKTLAIGASTYGNVRVGMSHFTPCSASTFLQLRIYHVNYDCRYRSSLSPKLHPIARGTPADAWGNAENLDIFTLYWLDGVP